MMNVKVNLWLINRARYNMKVRKLWRKMVECMGEEDAVSSAENTAKVLYLLPNHLKEQLVDKLIQTIDETKERFEQENGDDL